MVDPNKRYSLKEIKLHPWFQSQKEEDEYYQPNDNNNNNNNDDDDDDDIPLDISAHFDEQKNDNDNNNNQQQKPMQPTQIETPRSSRKFSDYDMGGSGAIHPSLKNEFRSLPFDSDHDGHDEEKKNKNKNKKEVKKSKSQKLDSLCDPNESGYKIPKRKSLQISIGRYDPNNDEHNKEHKEQTYDDAMKYINNKHHEHNSSNNSNNILSVDGLSDVSDYQTSDLDSSPSISPRNIEPISMTAFDLIGIVSTQMLNNVFTRSLQDTSTQIKTYTRFVSHSTPPKILYAIQEAVHRIADCTCRVASDRYEIKVIKRKQHRTIHINIQIFQTPVAAEYMIECRRTQGNIFKYHEFFEEFEKQYKNVIQQLNKNPNTTNNNNNSTTTPSTSIDSNFVGNRKKKKKEIKFRNKESIDEITDDNTSLNSKHSRSVSDYAVFANTNKLLQPMVKKVLSNPPSNNNNNNNNNNEEMIGSMNELTQRSLSQPNNQSNNNHQQPSHKKGKLSNVSLKSSASSTAPSHHSSISSVSEQKENLNCSASPTPTDQHNPSNHSFSIEDDLQQHSDSSILDDADLNNNNNNNNNSNSLKENQLKPSKRHRRSSSGKTFQTHTVTKGLLDIPSKVPESTK